MQQHHSHLPRFSSRPSPSFPLPFPSSHPPPLPHGCNAPAVQRPAIAMWPRALECEIVYSILATDESSTSRRDDDVNLVLGVAVAPVGSGKGSRRAIFRRHNGRRWERQLRRSDDTYENRSWLHVAAFAVACTTRSASTSGLLAMARSGSTRRCALAPGSSPVCTGCRTGGPSSSCAIARTWPRRRFPPSFARH